MLIAVMLLGMMAIAVSCSDDGDRSSQTESRTNNKLQSATELPPHDPASAWKQFLTANFAGDQACADCHRKEFEAHQRSGHSQTAIQMHESRLAEQLLKLDTYPDSRRDQQWSFQSGAGQFLVKDETYPTMPALSVTWLLGSGTHAQTAIAVDEKRRQGVELRWSWLANQKGLGLTPDHEQYDEYNRNSIECFGRPMQASDVLACLGCHMTVGPPPSAPFNPDYFIPNVGCERCHGPRQQHVELAKLGRGGESKPLINYANAEQYIAACAQCHRDENNISATADPNELVRFQPYGLKKSKCYLKSDGQLSCANCHDPHDATSHNRTQYIQQCQSCHQAADQLTVCPVKPQGDCIECHMPAVEWTAGIRFHDHWIRKPE
tara:strand:- start:19281 stop:20414 length:1134 start_codon:yes stop_codon:yes gene_type:complete